MTPIISKKLLSSGVFVNVKGGGFACKDGKYLENKKCIDCPKGFFCKDNEKTPCPEGQVSDTAQSECTPCEDGFYANENQDKCVKCEEGYKCSLGVKTVCPDGSYSSAGQAFCTPCPEGYYCKDGEKKSCETKFTNCNICNNSSCLSCKTGYEIENRKCVLKGFSQAFCDTLGSNLLYLTAAQNGGTAACVTKANVGDTYANGPEISPSAGVTVVKAGSNCSGVKCCWLGNNIGTTSSTCGASGNGNSTYSGCKRTVCTWYAANAACEAWEPVSGTKGKWRLPTENELTAWGRNILIIQRNQGKSGLELCDSYSGYDSFECYDAYSCTKSSGYSPCMPYFVWAADESSSTASCANLGSGSFRTATYNKLSAFSTRCVLDEDTYFNRKPKSLRSQADCDYFGKNLLFLTASQNHGKAACVTKANVGDIYANGPKISSSAGVTVVNAGTSCGSSSNFSSKCCWQGNNVGKTAGSCGSGNGNSTYSGCRRTVCTWAAANAVCKNWESVSGTKGKWRLPTQNELSAWSGNLSTIQKNQGKSGLELCDPDPNYGSAQCYRTDACPGSNNGCIPYSVWSSGENSSSKAGSHYLYSGSFNSKYDLKTYAYSARCVLDEDAVKSL